jgi:hypothetical protein
MHPTRDFHCAVVLLLPVAVVGALPIKARHLYLRQHSGLIGPANAKRTSKCQKDQQMPKGPANAKKKALFPNPRAFSKQWSPFHQLSLFKSLHSLFDPLSLFLAWRSSICHHRTRPMAPIWLARGREARGREERRGGGGATLPFPSLAGCFPTPHILAAVFGLPAVGGGNCMDGKQRIIITVLWDFFSKQH